MSKKVWGICGKEVKGRSFERRKEMSISLNIEKCCEDCADFEADVEKIRVGDFDDFDDSFSCITTIECKNKDRCKSMYYYLLNYVEK